MSRKKTIAFSLLVFSVVMMVCSLFVFPVGWDKLQSNYDTDKVQGRILLTFSAIMLIGSVFIFPIGWDKLKNILSSGRIQGKILLPLLVDGLLKPSIKLVGISNPNNIQINFLANGFFSQREIPPGRYQLEVFGKGIRKVQREVDIPEKKVLDLGVYLLQNRNDQSCKLKFPSFVREKSPEMQRGH